MRDLTVRTVYGAVDMVPFLRRLDGDKTARFLKWEKPAAIAALTDMGVPVRDIASALDMSGAAVSEAIAKYRQGQELARRRAAAKGRDREKWNRARDRRLAERIEIDGRLVHPTASHGSNSTYNAYGCRCLHCSAAHTEAQAASRRKKHLA